MLQRFLPSRSQGGVGHFTDQLADELSHRGHAVTMYALDPAPSGALYQVVQPGEHERVVSGRLGNIFGFGVWLARQDFSRFDVIHAMGDNHLLRTRTPVVRTLHGSALGEALHARRLVTKALFASIYPLELLGIARATRTASDSAASMRHFPLVHARTIFNGVADAFFEEGEAKSPDPSILFVGHRLHDRKRAYLLVDHFERIVRPAIPRAQLWLVFDNSVAAPGVRTFRDLPLAELAALYRRAWAFCLPSSYEGFGRPYAEAMASGTAVVATPNPGAEEILAGGDYGRIVSPDALGYSLVDLLRDTAARESLARLGRERACDFRWDGVARQYEELYAEAIAEKGTRSSTRRRDT
ncbi:MAG: glycosyltransferase family 4 protein [Chloroflexi bacterium]|nr:glycosyltransferase family 4 protein [Chloroflexota bacterium]